MNKYNNIKLTTPKEMKAELDKYIIGQDQAKKTICLAVYNHYKRIINNSNLTNGDVEFVKSNCLVLGPTGVGKTYMLQILAKMLNVGVYIGNTNSYTAAGYVGKDVESCLSGLLQACGNDVALTEVSICCLDEIDKIAKKDAGQSVTRDVSGECVQQSLLKMIEGDIVGVPPVQGRIHPEERLININTSNILFIGTGAFIGIDSIIKNRIGKGKIGFNCQKEESDKIKDEELLEYVTSEDLKQFGFIPEFIGRFPIITHANKLTNDELVKILKEPKNAIIRQYREMLLLDNTDISFTDEALFEIANVANRLQTGARALRSVVERVLEDIMFNAADNREKKKKAKLVVDKNYVIERTKHLSIFLKAV